jgi:hypothetical protein
MILHYLANLGMFGGGVVVAWAIPYYQAVEVSVATTADPYALANAVERP